MSKPKGAGDERADGKDGRKPKPEETPGVEPGEDLAADMPMIVDGAAGGLAAMQQPAAEPAGVGADGVGSEGERKEMAAHSADCFTYTAASTPAVTSLSTGIPNPAGSPEAVSRPPGGVWIEPSRTISGKGAQGSISLTGGCLGGGVGVLFGRVAGQFRLNADGSISATPPSPDGIAAAERVLDDGGGPQGVAWE